MCFKQKKSMQPIALRRKYSISALRTISLIHSQSRCHRASREYSFAIKKMVVLVITEIICIFAD